MEAKASGLLVEGVSRSGHTFRFSRQIGVQKSRDIHGCPGMNGMFFSKLESLRVQPLKRGRPSRFDLFGLL